MLRTLGAIVAGVVVGGLLVLGVEMLATPLFPPPPGFDPSDRDAMRQYLLVAPVGMLLLVLLAWAVGAFGGGWTAARLAPRTAVIAAFVVGFVQWGAGLYTLITLPHPLWFWIPALLLPIPAALLGARVARPRPAV